MKLKVSSKSAEKYSIEDEEINMIIQKLDESDITNARDLTISFLINTQFKTKFDEPEKDLTKYITLKLLDNKQITAETLSKYIDALWENENCSVREIGSFIMGQIYHKNPDKFFKQIIETAKLSNTWNDIDNWAGYSLEEYVAEDFDGYLEKLTPLISNEDQWIRRLVIVLLGRAFFITKNKDYAVKCFEVIESSFTDSRKIVLDANSWIIGTLGFRVYPEEVVRYFEKYSKSKDYTIIKLFSDVVRRSKLVREIDVKLRNQIKTILEIWLTIENPKTQKTVQSALDFIEK